MKKWKGFSICLIMFLLSACSKRENTSVELRYSSNLLPQGNIAVTQDAVLYFDELDPINLNYLELFRDSGEKEKLPLCGLENCGHNTSSCNAVFEHPSDVFCTEDAIYVIAEKQRMNGPLLYRLTADGRERTEVCRLQEATESEARFGYRLLGYTEEELYYSIAGTETAGSDRGFRLSLKKGALPEEQRLPGPEAAGESSFRIADARMQGKDFYLAVNWEAAESISGALVRIGRGSASPELVRTTEDEIVSFAIEGEELWMLCATDLLTGKIEKGQLSLQKKDICPEKSWILIDGKELLFLPQNMSWLRQQQDPAAAELRICDWNGNLLETRSLLRKDLPEGDLVVLGYRDGRLYLRQGEFFYSL